MSDTSALRMPHHTVPTPDADGRDLSAHNMNTGKADIVCRASMEPGYAMLIEQGPQFGHLHCNRCGWVTPEKVVLTYSEETGKHYLTWEDYVSAETNGYVVVGTSTRPNTRPVVCGPYSTQGEAVRARLRLRRKWQREESRHGHTVSTCVRVLQREA